MDSTDHDALSAVLSVSGIGKTYAEPVLADVSLSLRAPVTHEAGSRS
ncbi:MAG TPA: hypothetical protein VGV14_19355 [Rhodanobacter sp.]|nr:hypothetical protein [Rhodanobacter sp.]